MYGFIKGLLLPCYPATLLPCYPATLLPWASIRFGVNQVFLRVKECKNAVTNGILSFGELGWSCLQRYIGCGMHKDFFENNFILCRSKKMERRKVRIARFCALLLGLAIGVAGVFVVLGAKQSVQNASRLVATRNVEMGVPSVRGGYGTLYTSEFRLYNSQGGFTMVKIGIYFEWNGGIFDRNYITKSEYRGATTGALPPNTTFKVDFASWGNSNWDEREITITAQNGYNSVARKSRWYVPTNSNPAESNVSFTSGETSMHW
ncbi:MAG: hypothetical protein FWD76_00630 [Firmicutes bacterium]|nr:hypothetical protein [Bacillota bacterium]